MDWTLLADDLADCSQAATAKSIWRLAMVTRGSKIKLSTRRSNKFLDVENFVAVFRDVASLARLIASVRTLHLSQARHIHLDMLEHHGGVGSYGYSCP